MWGILIWAKFVNSSQNNNNELFSHIHDLANVFFKLFKPKNKFTSLSVGYFIQESTQHILQWNKMPQSDVKTKNNTVMKWRRGKEKAKIREKRLRNINFTMMLEKMSGTCQILTKNCEQLTGKYLTWVKFLSTQVWRWRTCYLISILKTWQTTLNVQVPKHFFLQSTILICSL